MRILLVEDDPDLTRQLKIALSDAGYAVDHAPDGEEAQFLGETGLQGVHARVVAEHVVAHFADHAGLEPQLGHGDAALAAQPPEQFRLSTRPPSAAGP